MANRSVQGCLSLFMKTVRQAGPGCPAPSSPLSPAARAPPRRQADSSQTMADSLEGHQTFLNAPPAPPPSPRNVSRLGVDRMRRADRQTDPTVQDHWGSTETTLPPWCQGRLASHMELTGTGQPALHLSAPAPTCQATLGPTCHLVSRRGSLSRHRRAVARSPERSEPLPGKPLLWRTGIDTRRDTAPWVQTLQAGGTTTCARTPELCRWTRRTHGGPQGHRGLHSHHTAPEARTRRAGALEACT